MAVQNAGTPDRWGSSEKDSKARPPSGLRCMLQVGARRMTDDLTFVSSAKKTPTWCIKSGSNVEAMAVAHCDASYVRGRRQDSASSTYWYALSGHGHEVRGASDALPTVRSGSCRRQKTYIGPVAHSNGWDLKTLNGMGVPPVGCTEEPNLLARGQFVNKVGDGCVQE